jgi:hypothetical protein
MKKHERDILRWYERRALMTQQTRLGRVLINRIGLI